MKVLKLINRAWLKRILLNLEDLHKRRKALTNFRRALSRHLHKKKKMGSFSNNQLQLEAVPRIVQRIFFGILLNSAPTMALESKDKMGKILKNGLIIKMV